MRYKSFSQGHSNYLDILKDGIVQNQTATRSFPKKLASHVFSSHGRVSDNTNFQTWIEDLVTNSGLQLQDFLVEPNLFCITQIVFDGSYLSHVSIQVVVAKKDIELNVNDNSFHYQRFDHHQGKLGKFLREPMVHSHVGYHDELRYKYYLSDGQNSFISFWDFVYRTFYYPSWIKWAAPIAKRSLGKANVDKFEKLLNLYDYSQLEHLKKYRSQIKGIKKAIRTEHWRLFDFDVDHRFETFHL